LAKLLNNKTAVVKYFHVLNYFAMNLCYKLVLYVKKRETRASTN